MTQLLASLLNDPTGRWFLYFGAVILFIGLGAYTFFVYINPRFKAADSKLNEIRENVSNDHPKNLRVEQDERHEDNSQKLDFILASVNSLQVGQNNQTVTIQNLYGLIVGHDTDIELLQAHDTKTRADIDQLRRDNNE
jgi:hypothetical protein